MATQIARGSRLGAEARRLGRLAFKLAAWLIAILLGLIVLYRWVDPPITPLMVLRMTEGAGGSDRTQPPPTAMKSATAPSALHNRGRDFMTVRSMMFALNRVYCRHAAFEMT